MIFYTSKTRKIMMKGFLTLCASLLFYACSSEEDEKEEKKDEVVTENVLLTPQGGQIEGTTWLFVSSETLTHTEKIVDTTGGSSGTPTGTPEETGTPTTQYTEVTNKSGSSYTETKTESVTRNYVSFDKEIELFYFGTVAINRTVTYTYQDYVTTFYKNGTAYKQETEKRIIDSNIISETPTAYTPQYAGLYSTSGTKVTTRFKLLLSDGAWVSLSGEKTISCFGKTTDFSVLTDALKMIEETKTEITNYKTTTQEVYTWKKFEKNGAMFGPEISASLIEELTGRKTISYTVRYNLIELLHPIDEITGYHRVTASGFEINTSQTTKTGISGTVPTLDKLISGYNYDTEMYDVVSPGEIVPNLILTQDNSEIRTPTLSAIEQNDSAYDIWFAPKVKKATFYAGEFNGTTQYFYYIPKPSDSIVLDSTDKKYKLYEIQIIEKNYDGCTIQFISLPEFDGSANSYCWRSPTAWTRDFKGHIVSSWTPNITKDGVISREYLTDGGKYTAIWEE